MENQELLEIKAAIAALPHIEYIKVQACADMIREIVRTGGVNGLLALALVGAEMQGDE